MRRLLPVIFFLGVGFVSAVSQNLPDSVFEARTTKGIGHIYNLEFESAEREFTDLIRSHPEDPSGHFFLAMATWWKIVIDLDNRQYDEQFLDSLDKVIELCDAMLEKNENDVKALFFKGGAIGFQGRLKFHRNDYLGAASAGKNALPIVQDASAIDPNNFDVYLGTGMYNYFADIIPEQYPWTKPLLLFLPSGDKQKGIRQLTACSEKGKYASIECSYFLLQIYHSYEKDYQKALVLAMDLNKRFPNNPMFHRYLARCYVSNGNWPMAQSACNEIISRVAKQQRGYSPAAWREAEYYLGMNEMNNKQYEPALKHFYKCDELSRTLDKEEASGFMVMTNLKIGMICDALFRRDAAEKQYRKVLEMKDYLDSRTQAEAFLKIPFSAR